MAISAWLPVFWESPVGHFARDYEKPVLASSSLWKATRMPANNLASPGNPPYSPAFFLIGGTSQSLMVSSVPPDI
jgi:hypothetical protein